MPLIFIKSLEELETAKNEVEDLQGAFLTRQVVEFCLYHVNFASIQSLILQQTFVLLNLSLLLFLIQVCLEHIAEVDWSLGIALQRLLQLCHYLVVLAPVEEGIHLLVTILAFRSALHLSMFVLRDILVLKLSLEDLLIIFVQLVTEGSGCLIKLHS